jgi:hypothetical protein
MDVPLYAHGLAAFIASPEVEATSTGHLRIKGSTAYEHHLYWNGNTMVAALVRDGRRASQSLGWNATLRDAIEFFARYIEGFEEKTP